MTNVNRQLGKGLERAFRKEVFSEYIDKDAIMNEANEYIEKHMPLDTPLSKKKFNKILNKMSKKLGKKLFKSINKEDMKILSDKSKEFGTDKVDIIIKYQKNKDYWTGEIPNEKE
ncbi:hypothetical protein LCGC14_0223440 [marine sediment metagenome]|uniref:Uncharacterized protein n=1 Tax=marine sediment metagenome TaxID=412755 RepID=A0A0F9WWK3_9ZZZZ|nr:hypothetical protein [bacterium]